MPVHLHGHTPCPFYSSLEDATTLKHYIWILNYYCQSEGGEDSSQGGGKIVVDLYQRAKTLHYSSPQLTEVQGSPVHLVQNTSGSANKDIDPPPYGVLLRLVGCASVYAVRCKVLTS